MAALAGTGLTGLAAEGVKGNAAAAVANALLTGNGDARIGRPVRIVCIGFKGGPTPLEEIVQRVDAEGAQHPDVIVLPELCRGQGEQTSEPLNGPTVTAMMALAQKHRTYIAVPIDRMDGGRRLNSVVLLDRAGQVAFIYNKVFPYWSEFDVHPSVSPSDDIGVFQADFARVGIATCFDVNFPEVWRRLADQGAELVIWPSEYSAGRSLQAHAINHHYYIVASTQRVDSIVYDITGERLLYEQSKHINVSRITLDLDRGIYHTNFNLLKRDKLLKEHAQDVAQEEWMELEQWFVLKAKKPGVSARELASQYGMEDLRQYIDRSRLEIDKRRGWEFAEKVLFPNKTPDELKS